MKPTESKKTFDCLEYKRRAQSEIYDAIRHLSRPEQVKYFKRRAEEGLLGNWWKSVRRAHLMDETQTSIGS
jgi:hypothetical protein